MVNKTSLVIIILIILAIAILFMPKAASTPGGGVACTMEAKLCPDGRAVGRVGPNCEFAACPAPQFSWEFKDMGEGDYGAPQTLVTLRIGSRRIDLGVHQGSCSVIEGSGWKLASGELSGVVCWFAGGGDELGVFKEGDKYIVKQGILDEGDGETGGTRGDFQMVLTL